MILAWPIANKLGKQRAVVIGLFLSVIGGLVSFIDVHNFVIVCIGVILKGIGSIPAMYVTLALLSDVLDHLEAKNGFRSDGFTMSVYGAIMVGMVGLGNGIINALLTASGYNATAATQDPGVMNMLVLCYLGIELICYAAIVIMMNFLKVEKHIKEDQKTILAHQKAMVLESGGTWTSPEERLRREQEEAERQAEEARKQELMAFCRKKGLSYETEEAKYQAKLAAKRTKKN
jgi:GPH family glycoside/pentoside/hexuronide:cation symporter